MTIMKLEGMPHDTESQSHRTENWMGKGYIEVPKNLESVALACGGWCNLIVKDGKLVKIEPVEPPAPPAAEPDPISVLRADLDYTMIILGVE